MTVNYVYPSAVELFEIEQELLPVITMDDPVFSPQVMPIESYDADLVEWEQEDNYYGLQKARSLNAGPNLVNPVGVSRFIVKPGYYADYMPINEDELTRLRQYGTFNKPIDLSYLVGKRQVHLLNRRVNLIRQIIWNLLGTGTFSVALPSGALAVQDSFTVQTLVAAIPWATQATSVPLGNLRAAQLLSRGHSMSFGKDALLFMNRGTWNSFIGNTNSADLYGRRTQGLGTYESVEQVNALLAGDDLPSIVIYDKTYLDENKAVQLFIPNNTAILIGRRDDRQPIGAYMMTRHASNPGLGPGPITAVEDSAQWGQTVPRQVRVVDAHNGGPALRFPSAVVVITC